MTIKNLNKFQTQDSDLEYLFWRFDKHIKLSEKTTLLATPLIFLNLIKETSILAN